MKRCGARLIAGMLVLGTAACGGAGAEREGAPVAAGADSTVAVVLGNFFVSAEPASVPSGNVTFDVEVQTGPGAPGHALTVLRTDLPADGLPTDVEGRALTADEEIEIVKWEGVTSRYHQMKVNLPPGRYALICNIADHYGRGMRTGFEVT